MVSILFAEPILNESEKNAITIAQVAMMLDKPFTKDDLTLISVQHNLSGQ